jgi:hypothetical protein
MPYTEGQTVKRKVFIPGTAMPDSRCRSLVSVPTSQSPYWRRRRRGGGGGRRRTTSHSNGFTTKTEREREREMKMEGEKKKGNLWNIIKFGHFPHYFSVHSEDQQAVQINTFT